MEAVVLNRLTQHSTSRVDPWGLEPSVHHPSPQARPPLPEPPPSPLSHPPPEASPAQHLPSPLAAAPRPRARTCPASSRSPRSSSRRASTTACSPAPRCQRVLRRYRRARSAPSSRRLHTNLILFRHSHFRRPQLRLRVASSPLKPPPPHRRPQTPLRTPRLRRPLLPCTPRHLQRLCRRRPHRPVRCRPTVRTCAHRHRRSRLPVPLR